MLNTHALELDTDSDFIPLSVAAYSVVTKLRHRLLPRRETKKYYASIRNLTAAVREINAKLPGLIAAIDVIGVVAECDGGVSGVGLENDPPDEAEIGEGQQPLAERLDPPTINFEEIPHVFNPFEFEKAFRGIKRHRRRLTQPRPDAVTQVEEPAGKSSVAPSNYGVEDSVEDGEKRAEHDDSKAEPGEEKHNCGFRL